MALHGLYIANNYPGTSSELYGCVNDAKDAADALKRWTSSATTILNSQADHDGVFKAGRKFLDRLGKKDCGIISISGHGTREKIGGAWHEAIVLADFSLVYDNEFDDLLGERERSSMLIVLADTCHAKGLARGGSIRGTVRLARRNLVKAIPLSRCDRHRLISPSKMRSLRNVVYFSAAQEDEYAYDGTFNGRANGAMTYHLLNAFRQRGDKSTCKWLYQKVREQLPSDDYDQTPAYLGSRRNMSRTLRSFLGAAFTATNRRKDKPKR